MKQFVYISYYRFGIGPVEIDGLLARFRGNNERNGITGVLLYDDRSIMRFVEGPDEAVDRLRNRAYAEPCLVDVFDLYTGTSDDRLFPDWPMGCGPDVQHLSALWTPLCGPQSAGTRDILTQLPEKIGGLLRTFRTGNAGLGRRRW